VGVGGSREIEKRRRADGGQSGKVREEDAT
jgi:hypothetical protein